MVSTNPTSPEAFSIDAEDTTLPGLHLIPLSPPGSPAAVENTLSSPTDELNSKKIRKSYTITKSREIWSEPEHDRFLEALHLFDRDWKKIEAFIGSKTVIQIRSHAQKYFLKVQKSGSNEHLPPPRPKRKAAHPYPQKAPKTSTLPEATTSQLPFVLLESTLQGQDTTSIPSLPSGNAALSCGVANTQSIDVPDVPKGNLRSTGTPVANNASSSVRTIPMTRAGGMNEPANHAPPLRVLPDFGQVYHFIGSVFDPEATDHVQRLKKMDRIDVETVLLLMRNLSVNLTSPGFQDDARDN